MAQIIKNGKAHVLELSNRASIQKLNEESVSGLTARLDNHESGLNANAHGIPNIAGLQTALNGKASSFTGFTGTIEVVTSVDFTLMTTASKTMEYANGILISVS